MQNSDIPEDLANYKPNELAIQKEGIKCLVR